MMTHKLPRLPFPKNSLVPHLSAETITFHYEKHHQGYIDKLNKLIPGTEFENSTLEEIVLKADGPVFNNGAQAWNHSFFWASLSPSPPRPQGSFLQAIESGFGSFGSFVGEFTKAAVEHFASGWAWLVKDNDGNLSVITTHDADNPLRHGKTPLLTCDLWEHAYYIDYRNERPKYVKNILQILNWDFAERNFAAVPGIQAA
jgi:Fe-Mn family superoxide dismutase